MDNQKPFSGKGLVNFLIFFFHLSYYILWVITIITIFIMGLSLININNPTGFLGLDFHVFFSLDEELGITHWGEDQTSEFSIVYAMGNVKLSNVPYSFMVYFCLMALLQFAFLLLSIRLTIKILKTVKNKSFLLIENAVRLRWIALLGIAMVFIDKLISIINSSYLSNKLEFPGIKFTNMNIYTFFNIESVINSLFLLVIAEVFRIGAKLKEEHDLTI